MGMYRYSVTICHRPTGGGYATIWDRKLGGECSLPRTEMNLSDTVPLRWYYEGTVHSPESLLCADRARRWLELCTARWGRNPNVDAEHPQDVNWERVADHLREAARVQTYGV